MSIISFNVQTPMLQGVAPRTCQMVTTDNLATITAAGYMNKNGQVLAGMNLSPTDVINVIYSYSTSTNSGTFEIFTPSISAGVITLVQWANPGDVLLPVVSGDLAVFNGTTGQIKDTGISAANVVQSQSTAANNNVSLTVIKTLTFTQLASAAKVNIVAHPSATSQFAILDIKVLKSTGLSGGGGDRLLAVSDGTIVFNNAGITAAVLGTPILTVWGGTGNPLAIGASEISTAGADIYFQYSGGTTDYTAGSVQIAVTLVQVTA